MPTDYRVELTQAQQLAKLKIALRCKHDLFFLCKYVLGYDLMTEATHGELCRYAATVAPHSNRIDTVAGTPTETIVNPTSKAPPENFRGELDVHSPLNIPATEEGLSQADISDTSDSLDVHHAQGDKFDERIKQALFLLPRGTFKSSVVTIGLTIQMILNDPDVRVLIDSETFGKAKMFLAEVKGHLEGNEELRDIYHTLYGSFPDARKREDIWTDSAINISARKRARKEPTIMTSGVDKSINGMHFDLIIMDDLMSEQNITTKEQIDKVINHYKLSFSLLDPGRPLVVIGTRWDYNDVYQYILDNEAKNFNILIRKAYNPDGSLFFPERLTEEFLQKTKETQGSYLFSCQYLNEPVDDATATFKKSNLVRIDPLIIQNRPINWYMSVDPSEEGPYSDYAAIVIAGMDNSRQLYVKTILRRKLTYSGIIDAVFDLYNRHNTAHDDNNQIRQILVETVATQKSIGIELSHEQRRRNYWLPIVEIKSRTKSKEVRIKSLAPLYEFGHVFHLADCPQVDDLEYELIHFPKGTHDDIIDALATVLEVANPSGKRDREKDEAKRNRIQAALKPRSPLTGV